MREDSGSHRSYDFEVGALDVFAKRQSCSSSREGRRDFQPEGFDEDAD